MSKSQTKSTPKNLIDQIVSRARGMKPAARAEFLRHHSVAEIIEIHEAVVGEAKPKTPRPILEKRILHALAEPTPQPAHLDQDMNILVTEHHEAITAAAATTTGAVDEAQATATSAFEPPTDQEAPVVNGADDGSQDASEAHDHPASAPPDIAGVADTDTANASHEGDDDANDDEEDGGITVAEDAAASADGDDADAKDANEAPTSEADAGMAAPERELPPVGTVIVKSDRHGKERVRCQVVEGGVLYAGTTYKSLSSAAVAAARDLGLTTKTLNGWSWWGITKPGARAATKKDAFESLERAWDRYRERAQAAVADAAGDDTKARLRQILDGHSTTLRGLTGEAVA